MYQNESGNIIQIQDVVHTQEYCPNISSGTNNSYIKLPIKGSHRKVHSLKRLTSDNLML